MIIHSFTGTGNLVLFDQSDASNEIEKTTKRMELAAAGDHIVMTLTVSKDYSPATTKREVRMSTEDLFSLIEAYIEITRGLA